MVWHGVISLPSEAVVVALATGLILSGQSGCTHERHPAHQSHAAESADNVHDLATHAHVDAETIDAKRDDDDANDAATVHASLHDFSHDPLAPCICEDVRTVSWLVPLL